MEGEFLEPQEILNLIKNRRSQRKFTTQKVDDNLVQIVLEAGSWAPSGMNNQPWRFIVVRDQVLKNSLAKYTYYSSVLQNAPILILVFIHKPSMYDKVKDYQSIGACLQNMLIMAYAQGLGTVWIGEIVKNDIRVREVLKLHYELKLMAVIALGWPIVDNKLGERKSLDELILVSL